MEYQAQNVGGLSSGWGFWFFGLSVNLALLLGIARLLIWGYQNFGHSFKKFKVLIN